MSYCTEIEAIFNTLGLAAPTESAGGLEVRTPIDGSLLARVALSTEAQVSVFVGRAHQCFLRWREVPAPKRGELVRAFGEAVRRHKQPLGAWLERQGRFAHLVLPGNEHLLPQLQEWVDFEWDLLLRKCDEIPEAQWDKASSRHKAEPFVMHPSKAHLESLGEPLTA